MGNNDIFLCDFTSYPSIFSKYRHNSALYKNTYFNNAKKNTCVITLCAQRLL